jgi:excisionase family DNA binding protein
MIAGVELPPDAAARLASALNAERRRVMAAGHRWPLELDLLATIALRSVRSGHVAVRSGQTDAEPVPVSDDDLVSLHGTARMLGVSERTLRRLRSDGSIPTVAIAGRRPMVRRSAIAAYIAEREQNQ